MKWQYLNSDVRPDLSVMVPPRVPSLVPPLRLGFPSPLDGQADGTALKSVMWSSDELIVDGVTFELAAGTDYLFSGEGLEVSASATDGE